MSDWDVSNSTGRLRNYLRGFLSIDSDRLLKLINLSILIIETNQLIS